MNTQNNVDLNRTLGDLVAERPGRAEILESLNLDFCCGGGRSLLDACREAGLDAATVARLLANPPVGRSREQAEPDVQAMSLTDLADHIEATHHAFMRHVLPRLAQMATKVVSAHGERHAYLADMRGTLGGLTAEIEMHMDKEEQVLFPAIRALEQSQGAASFHCGHLSNPIRVMEHEHEQAGAALARLRASSGDYRVPDDACETFRAYYAALQDLERDLHRHIHKENNVLFPRALALAGGAEQVEAF